MLAVSQRCIIRIYRKEVDCIADLIDLTGQKFGYYTVLRKGSGRYTKGGQRKTTWVCQCVCGNIREIDSQVLRRSETISCGCMRYKTVSQKKRTNHVGEKYGRLTVVRFLEEDERENHRRSLLCKCDCGNYVQVNLAKLKSGHTKSCGCHRIDVIGSLNRKYKHSDRRLYGIFSQMHNRCENEKNRRYKNYGGRGITVCEEWSDKDKGFDVFYEWAMANGYAEDLTLDRIDNYKGYSPDNCRWLTNKQQQSNKRYHVYATYNGETHNMAEWAEILGINRHFLYNHVIKGNQPLEEVIAKYNKSTVH